MQLGQHRHGVPGHCLLLSLFALLTVALHYNGCIPPTAQLSLPARVAAADQD